MSKLIMFKDFIGKNFQLSINPHAGDKTIKDTVIAAYKNWLKKEGKDLSKCNFDKVKIYSGERCIPHNRLYTDESKNLEKKAVIIIVNGYNYQTDPYINKDIIINSRNKSELLNIQQDDLGDLSNLSKDVMVAIVTNFRADSSLKKFINDYAYKLYSLQNSVRDTAGHILIKQLIEEAKISYNVYLSLVKTLKEKGVDFYQTNNQNQSLKSLIQELYNAQLKRMKELACHNRPAELLFQLGDESDYDKEKLEEIKKSGSIIYNSIKEYLTLYKTKLDQGKITLAELIKPISNHEVAQFLANKVINYWIAKDILPDNNSKFLSFISQDVLIEYALLNFLYEEEIYQTLSLGRKPYKFAQEENERLIQEYKYFPFDYLDIVEELTELNDELKDDKDAQFLADKVIEYWSLKDIFTKKSKLFSFIEQTDAYIKLALLKFLPEEKLYQKISIKIENLKTNEEEKKTTIQKYNTSFLERLDQIEELKKIDSHDTQDINTKYSLINYSFSKEEEIWQISIGEPYKLTNEEKDLSFDCLGEANQSTDESD